MTTHANAKSEQRKAYVRRIIQNHTLEDIYSDERKMQWAAFSHEDQQRVTESTVFVGFVKASGLRVDPFEHENEDPPYPDIRLTVMGQPYYFELGEIVDQGLAWAFADSAKKGEITGCSFSQREPLLKILTEKCANVYTTENSPVDLLLHYSKQHPDESVLSADVRDCADRIAALVANSQFARIWIYNDCRPQKVLWRTARQPVAA